MRKALTLMTAFVFLLGCLGCASSTFIKSIPPGAKLYIDGQVKGETPYTYTDRSIAGTWRNLTLKKEGYKDFSGHIKRDELSVVALVGGIFLVKLSSGFLNISLNIRLRWKNSLNGF